MRVLESATQEVAVMTLEAFHIVFSWMRFYDGDHAAPEPQTQSHFAVPTVLTSHHYTNWTPKAHKVEYRTHFKPNIPAGTCTFEIMQDTSPPRVLSCHHQTIHDTDSPGPKGRTWNTFLAQHANAKLHFRDHARHFVTTCADDIW